MEEASFLLMGEGVNANLAYTTDCTDGYVLIPYFKSIQNLNLQYIVPSEKVPKMVLKLTNS